MSSTSVWKTTGRLFTRTAELIVTIILAVIFLPVWVLPWGPAMRLARFYGHVICAFWPSACRVAMINLRRAYGPDMQYPKARRWTRQVVANMVQSVAEGLKFVKRKETAPVADWENLCVIEDQELKDRILADPRPKIFVSGHFGSWPMALMIAGRSIRPNAGAVVVRKPDNPFLDWLLRFVKLESASQSIQKRGAINECLRRLEQNCSIALLLDENGYPHGPFVQFFGRAAATHKTAALLSLQTGSPIVVGGLFRSKGRCAFLYKLAVIESAQYRERADPILDITQDITQILERWIREDPLQWRWIHWRWKHRPDGKWETYTRQDLKQCFDEPNPVA